MRASLDGRFDRSTVLEIKCPAMHATRPPLSWEAYLRSTTPLQSPSAFAHGPGLLSDTAMKKQAAPEGKTSMGRNFDKKKAMHPS
jgi:hypothetical protein